MMKRITLLLGALLVTLAARNYFSDSSGRFFAGVWESTPGRSEPLKGRNFRLKCLFS